MLFTNCKTIAFMRDSDSFNFLFKTMRKPTKPKIRKENVLLNIHIVDIL